VEDAECDAGVGDTLSVLLPFGALDLSARGDPEQDGADAAEPPKEEAHEAEQAEQQRKQRGGVQA
jgi:hypothetical protein